MIKSYSKNKKQKNTSNKTTVYAVGGGKGGVGKSFFTTNLALLFAKNGYKTLIIDLDFGGANTHTYLEMKNNEKSVFSFLNGEVLDLDKVIQGTEFKDLSIITAHGDWTRNEDHLYEKVPQLLSEARRKGFDRILLDLGAGTHEETTTGFIEADHQLTLLTPEPTSVENTYFFLKKAFYQKFMQASEKYNFTEETNLILKNKSKYKISRPEELLKTLELEFPEVGYKISNEVRSFQPLFIINQCRTSLDYKLATSLSQISRNYFGVNSTALGYMSHDNKVWQSIRAMKPLCVAYPHCFVLTEIERIYRALKRIEQTQNKTYPIAS